MSNALQPFYAASGIYCCLHSGSAPARTGILCVQPLFGEYIQHHRAFVVLAERLAARNIPCLRYDHHGTGDSADDLRETSVARWRRDVEAMAAELVNRTGVEGVILIGARFGAALALAAVNKIVRTAGLALWEPVWNGREFLRSLLETHARVLSPYMPPEEQDLSGSHDVLGFEIPERLWNEIEDFDPRPVIAPDIDILTIESAESIEGRALSEEHERLSRRPVDYPHGWLDPERGMYDVLVPLEVLSQIVRWCQERA